MYGRITGFSASAGLNLVRRALATCIPDTWSSSGSWKMNFLVLWLTISTSLSSREMKPWSPPRKAFFGGPATASFTLASAFWAPEDPKYQ